MLFQTGYLTIRAVQNGRVTLGFPNQEVSTSMARLYADELLGGQCYSRPDGPSLVEILAAGQIDEVVDRFNHVFNAVDYQRYPIDDEATCRGYLQVLMMSADMVPAVELHSAHGRSNLEVTAGDRRWVFEIKFARNEQDSSKLLQEGIAQMRNCQYGETFAGKTEKTLMRVVLVFSSEKRQFVGRQFDYSRKQFEGFSPSADMVSASCYGLSIVPTLVFS